MSANDKVAASFRGADKVRLVKVTAEPRPEQALRNHVADLLTDVDHFAGCMADPDCDCGICVCTCLIGRIRSAISTEQIGGAA